MQKSFIHAVIISILALAGNGVARASDEGSFSVAPIFTDYAVLQRERPVPVWGTAPAGSVITVSFGDAEAETKVPDDGQWRVDLPALKATEGATLIVVTSAGDRAAFEHVAVGDVWLCSGQSNMEFEVRKASNAEAEIANSADDGLRLFLVPRASKGSPQQRFGAPVTWRQAGPGSARDFSAACFFMGQSLRQQTGVPVGLIASSWGGSVIQEWLGAEAVKGLDLYADELELLALHDRNPDEAARRHGRKLSTWLQSRLEGFADWASPVSVNQTLGFWENWGVQEFRNFDGVATFETEVTLTEAQRKAAQAVIVGRVDDTDQTRLNGTIVGSMTGWDQVRQYPVVPDQLVAGVNKLDVTVIDTGGGGGIWGPEARGVLLKDGSVVPFSGVWTVRRGPGLSLTGNPPLVPWQPAAGLTTLYNGMIAPIGPYALTGYAWYQGESNVAEPERYARLLPALIDNWRSQFGGTQFLVIQLAGFGAMEDHPFDADWARLREAQRHVVIADRDTALVPAIDIGDRYDIHPTNKRELGRRMALAIETAGQGHRVGTGISVVRHDNVADVELGRAYRLLGGATGPVGFELCDKDGQCRFVDASLTSDHTVRLDVTASDHEIRYLWSNSPVLTLFDEAGVPLPPFRLELGE